MAILFRWRSQMTFAMAAWLSSRQRGTIRANSRLLALMHGSIVHRLAKKLSLPSLYDAELISGMQRDAGVKGRLSCKTYSAYHSVNWRELQSEQV